MLRSRVSVKLGQGSTDRAQALRFVLSQSPTHAKDGFYHDGRFATISDVVNHYDSCLSLGLGDDEKADLVQYLKSIPANLDAAAQK